MKKIIGAFLTITILISCEHKLNSKVENAVNSMSEETCINTNWTEGNESYKNLLKVATVEDLVYLTDNENGYVRYYSYLGLREKNYPKIKEIYKKHKTDTETINTSNGACLRGSASISNLMLWALDPEDCDCKFGFTQEEYDKINQEERDKIDRD